MDMANDPSTLAGPLSDSVQPEIKALVAAEIPDVIPSTLFEGSARRKLFVTHPFRVLSLGAGLDSTTLILLSEHGELPRLDAAIFADTQAEPQYVYNTLKWLTSAVSIPIYRVTAGNLETAVLDAAQHMDKRLSAGHVGQPPFFVKNVPNVNYATAVSGGTLWRKCTHDFKIVPIRRKVRELLGVKAVGRLPNGVHVEQWIGFTKDDLGRTFCSDVKWITNVFPMILPLQMSRRDCASWLEAHGYPIPQKSSCVFCPFHRNAYWVDMRDNRPDEWHRAVQFEARLQQGHLPGVRGIPYLHRSMVPLPMAPIDALDGGTPELFCLACNT